MTLEFHMQKGSIHTWLMDYVRDNLLKIYRKDPRISRAEVYFREKSFASGLDKLCEIDLSIVGGSMFIQRRAGSFEQAAREAVESLAEKIDERTVM